MLMLHALQPCDGMVAGAAVGSMQLAARVRLIRPREGPSQMARGDGSRRRRVRLRLHLL